ncbi:MAG: DNA alkylation repair protein, partial [Desulfurococcales archaeon]|nr:DNA alkylation repair protein [Desulfurococcales archaeon]
SQRREEFVRRAGFALMAKLAISDKKADDAVFESFFPYILEGARDERNYVRKAASWALRRVGKRNLHLNRRAVEVARELGKMDSRSAKLIAREAMKELASEKLQEKIKNKG